MSTSSEYIVDIDDEVAMVPFQSVEPSQFHATIAAVEGLLKKVSDRESVLNTRDLGLYSCFNVLLGSAAVLFTFFGGVNAGFYVMMSNRTLTCGAFYIVMIVTMCELIGTLCTYLLAKKVINTFDRDVPFLNQLKELVDEEANTLVLFAHTLEDFQSVENFIDIRRIISEVTSLRAVMIDRRLLCEGTSTMYIDYVFVMAVISAVGSICIAGSQCLLFCNPFHRLVGPSLF